MNAADIHPFHVRTEDESVEHPPYACPSTVTEFMTDQKKKLIYLFSIILTGAAVMAGSVALLVNRSINDGKGNSFLGQSGSTDVPSVSDPTADPLEQDKEPSTDKESTVRLFANLVFEDDGDRDGIRPDSVTLHLMANGDRIASKEVTAQQDWVWDFGALSKYENETEILYTLTAESIDGYTVMIDGYTVTAHHTPARTQIAGEKIWNDDNDRDGMRPDTITVRLLANGKELRALTVSAKDNWSWHFDNLSRYENGKEIEYTISIDPIEGYTTTVNGTDSIGQYTPKAITVNGGILWDDDGDRDCKRPDTVTVRLFADGTEIASDTVSSADGWKWQFDGLDRYQSGKLIHYYIALDAIDCYTIHIQNQNATLTYSPKKTQLSGNLVWNDDGNRDGKRPEGITVCLLANGKQIASLAVTAADNWSWQFSDLARYENGKEIIYTIAPLTIEHYQTELDQNDLIAAYIPEIMTLNGTVVWNDGGDRDGKRPDSITLQLFANGVKLDTLSLSANEECWAFTELYVYSGGKPIEYRIAVTAVDGYTCHVENGTVQMTYTPETVQIGGYVNWDDRNDNDGMRPDRITLHLLANGARIASKTVTADDNWSFGFADLSKYQDGSAIVYTLTADTAIGYTVSINGFDITCSYKTKTCTVSGLLTWNDDGNRDGKRPQSVTVTLFANGARLLDKKISAADGWRYSFTDLDTYLNGSTVSYYITVSAIDGYAVKTDGYNIVCTYTPQKMQIYSNVTWLDMADRDGIRPDSITLQLLANGKLIATATADRQNNWSIHFADLDKYQGGELIHYTVSAQSIDGYDIEIDGHNVTARHTPERISIEGQIVWNDDNDRDGCRPGSVTVSLYANGQKISSLTLLAKQNQNFAFTELDKYQNGQPILYTVSQSTVNGYTLSVDGYVITSTHTPERLAVSGSVLFMDASNRDGKRPDKITVNLLANGKQIASKTLTTANTLTFDFSDLYKYENGSTIVYSVTADLADIYTVKIDGYRITASYDPEKISLSGGITWDDDGNRDALRPDKVTLLLFANGVKIKSCTVTAQNSWQWQFSDLERYDKGNAIVYTVKQESVAGYTTTASGLQVVNSHAPQTVSVGGSILWQDDGDRDGKRPESVTVTLYADNVKVDTKTVSAGENWSYTFDSLYKYEGGRPKIYTVRQNAVADYETDSDGLRFTNRHTPQKTAVEGSVLWQDDEDRDGKRPQSITVHLYADGVKIDSAVISADTSVFRFADLYACRAGKAIVYTVTAQPFEGYTVTASGYTVTCRHQTEKISVSGSIGWDDDQNRDGKRPNSITVNLLANGNKVRSITVSPKESWIWQFTDLVRYENKKEIVYTVSVSTIKDYSVTLNGLNATAKHTPETATVTGTITWIDGSNEEGKRPAAVTVHLLANGVKISSASVSTKSNSYSFPDLFVYQSGKKITYTVQQDKIDGYTVTVEDFKIANTLIPVVKPAQITLLKPVASGVLVKENDYAIIDYSNTADGYVMVKYKEQTDLTLLAQITGPTTTYTYYIKGGEWTVFPLSDGNGSYAVKVFKHVVDNRYAIVIGQKCTATLRDEFAPFIRPNQYVNYENAVNTMNTAAALLTDDMSVLEKVEKIYNYVVNTLTYDYDKMVTVTSNYLPVLDDVLKEKKGICFDYAALMTGMLRSQNVPCKLVVGYADGGYHAWISVWSPETGWIDGTIYFNGTNWERLDPTYASGGMTNLDKINYVTKYIY